MPTLVRPVSLLSLVRAINGDPDRALAAFDRLAARAAAVEPALCALTATDWPAARAQVAACASLPLAGLPVGVKDIFDTATMPTAYGSAIYAGHRPMADAAIVHRLRLAGATIPAKTTTTEFAFLEPTKTRNPWDLHRGPGGSSAGSAAAVAAGMLPAAIGTQTAGSTLRPASFCGIVGFKPSFGLLPTNGLKAFAPSLDTVGLFTAGVEDMRWLLAALCGWEPHLEVPPASTLRLGLLRTPWDDEATSAAQAVRDLAEAALAGAGVTLTQVPAPAALVAAHAAHGPLQAFECVPALAGEWQRHRAALSPRLATYLEEAAAVSAEDYQAARSDAAAGRRAMAQIFTGVDAVLTFAAADIAPQDRDTTGSPVFNRVWTLLGLPAVTVPTATSVLPVGLQLVGPAHGDARLLAVAAAVAAILQPDDR